MTIVTHLRCEYRSNPLGIDVNSPRLSWQIQSKNQGARQTAYRVFAASDLRLLNEGGADLWDTGRIESDQSTLISYGGEPLRSRQRVYWRITLWDETGAEANSEAAWFETGLLDASDWQAQWIGTAFTSGPRSTFPVPHLRKAFILPAPVVKARLYVTALGLFECSINGQRIGKDVFAPGWTDYDKRVQYLTYDVTDLLRQGDNVIGALLGDGWAVGYIAWLHRQNYVDRPQLLAQMEITLADGSTRTIVSDGTWSYQFGPITHSDFLEGEAYDARREMPGWDGQDFNAIDWLLVSTFQHSDIQLVTLNGPTVQRIEELTPVVEPMNRATMGRKRFLFDLGQNMVGRVRFKGSAAEGTTIIIRFAEVLEPNGAPYYTNLRTAHATDYYTFKGDGEETWESQFTFHGFRYVEIEGYTGPISRETITGIVLHSQMEQTGEFSTSDPLLNQLQQNILWGQKGNFVDVPTDCPQRDERLGWTGDIQVFVRTAAYNMDVAGFMTKWAQDVADAQDTIGQIPPVVPKIKASFMDDGGPAWADAVIICPWTIYLCYGDRRILENNYAVMSKFMTFLLDTSPGFIRCAPDYEGWPGFGDWLSINANTPRDLIGTAFLAYDAGLMAQIAEVLGKREDAVKWQQLFADVKQAFGERYLKGSKATPFSVPLSEARRMAEAGDKLSHGNAKTVDYGLITSEIFNTDLFTPTQTAYVLALHFNLLPDHLRSVATEELAADIERREMHLSAGFVGSPYLLHVLSDNGRIDIAYALLQQKTWPSWLYPVTQGATTIWERWDGWTGDNGFQTPEMNSFNHYAYGAIGDWMYQNVAGIQIDPTQPGYKHVIMHPQPDGELTSACGKLKTLYGELASEWKMVDGSFDWTIVIPANTSATVHLPVKESREITLNGKSESAREYLLEAGMYRFIVS